VTFHAPWNRFYAARSIKPARAEGLQRLVQALEIPCDDFGARNWLTALRGLNS